MTYAHILTCMAVGLHALETVISSCTSHVELTQIDKGVQLKSPIQLGLFEKFSLQLGAFRKSGTSNNALTVPILIQSTLLLWSKS